jgi:transposase
MRYSNDLRARVAKRLEIPNLSTSELIKISKDFEISLETLKKWRKKLKEGTLYKIVKKGGKPRVYDYEKLREFVEKNPDKYLHEIKTELFEKNGQKASISGIDDALKRMNLKLKKKSFYTKKGTKKKEKNLTKKS